MNRFILSAAILTAQFMLFHAPPDDRGGAGNPKPTLEQQLASARSDLATAQSNLDAATKERDTAKATITTLTDERDNLQRQFDALTAEATKAKTDLATTTSDRDTHKTASEAKDKTLATKDSRIKNLESLCQIKGLNPDAAPPALDEPGAKLSVAHFEERIKAAKTPADQAAITKEFEKAFADGRIA